MRAHPARPRDALWEVILPVVVLIASAWVGRFTGWRGERGDILFTKLWPFYCGLRKPPLWTGRMLLPVAAFLLAWFPLRRWARGDGDRVALLCGLIGGAWLFHFGLAVQELGADHALRDSFERIQEYWQDVKFVHAGFLARFPDLDAPLSQHGATHPPGFSLALAWIRRLGFSDVHDAELLCSTFPVLAALPLYGATRRLVDEPTARMAVVLFLFACVVSLFAVLVMDVLSMLLAALALYGLARALDGERRGGVLWGVALAAASLCTFLAGGLVLSYGALLAPRLRTLDRRRWMALACGPGAFLVCYAVWMLGFGYRPFHVLARALASLATSDDMRRSALAARFGTPIAFFGMLGMPLAGLATRACGDATWRLVRGRDRWFSSLVAAAALPVLFGAVVGKPRGEVEHVYLVFVPMTALAAATAARHWYSRSAAWLSDFAVPLLALESLLIQVFINTYW
jgi:hypothetical protein